MQECKKIHFPKNIVLWTNCFILFKSDSRFLKVSSSPFACTIQCLCTINISLNNLKHSKKIFQREQKIRKMPFSVSKKGNYYFTVRLSYDRHVLYTINIWTFRILNSFFEISNTHLRNDSFKWQHFTDWF